MVVLDCCHSAGIGQPKGGQRAGIKLGLSESCYERLMAGRGRVIFASCRDNERSYVRSGERNSIFTRHLLTGLAGAVPGPDGLIRVFDLFHYLQPRVTADEPKQHPVFKCEVEENFPVALHSGGKGTASPSESPRDSCEYDVFLSYRDQEPDMTWTRTALAVKLKEQGLRVCIDHECFRLAAWIVTEIERAVENSRYTVAVLSPAYLQSNFAELENVLAEHLGLEESQHRLIAVMRAPCTPRLGIRARMWLDMTDDAEFEANVARLVHELRLPPDK
jgi:hypothetical protein